MRRSINTVNYVEVDGQRVELGDTGGKPTVIDECSLFRKEYFPNEAPAQAGDPYLEALVLGGVGITRAAAKPAASRAWSGLASIFGREASSGVWAKSIYQRGKEIEDLLGAQLKLGANLNKLWRTDFVKGVDFIGNRGGKQLFSQVTSMNLSSASNTSEAAITRTLSKKANSLQSVVASGTVSYGSRSIAVQAGAEKQLVVAISSYKPSIQQMVGLAKAMQYAKSIGVKVAIRVVR